jgi:hypothetical protein
MGIEDFLAPIPLFSAIPTSPPPFLEAMSALGRVLQQVYIIYIGL